MAYYKDPYYNQTNQPQHQQQYTDAPEFNPYTNDQVAHPPYETSVFEDDEAYPRRDASAGASTLKNEPSTYQDAGLPDTGFTGGFRQSKSAGDLRSWRRDERGNLWVKGGRGRCVGRFCCCTLLITLFLIVSIVLTLALWVRPPNITVNDVGTPANGSAFQVTSNSLNLNIGVNISVFNPNYFNVAFSQIKADLTYPVNNTDVGGGQKNDITFHSNTETTFNFPFTVTYNTANDPNKAVLTDLLTKCGIIGGQKTDIVVKYQITLGIRILFVTISPSFSNNFNFACPVSESDIAELLKGSGINIPGLT